jgi:hypothetical protein
MVEADVRRYLTEAQKMRRRRCCVKIKKRLKIESSLHVVRVSWRGALLALIQPHKIG